MKVVLSDNARVENRGTIMHMTADALSDVTILSYGTIFHAEGCRIYKMSTMSEPPDPEKTIIKVVPRQSDLQRIEELEKECARLRAQLQTAKENREPKNEDIYWGRKRIKDQKREIERLRINLGILQGEKKEKDETIGRLTGEIERLRSREYVRRVESENEGLRHDVSYLNGVANDLRSEVADLRHKLEGTDRQQMIDTIEDLRDKLKRAMNRETVQKLRADDEARRAYRATQQVWDQYKPTKEQVKAYYKTIRNMMDVETDY